MNPKAAIALFRYSICLTGLSIGNGIRSDRRRSLGYGLLVVHTVLFGYLLSQSYFRVDALTWLGIFLFPYVAIIRHQGVYSFRYGILLALLLLLSVWLPMRTLHFGLLTIGLLFILESSMGKVNLLPLVLIGVLSPFFRYTSIIFNFPIRLQLSQWAGNILSACGFQVTVFGNVVRLGDTEFAVDAACMGLQMTETALLMTIFLVAYYERKTRQQLRFGWLAGLLAITLLLNTVSNLLRMLLLIIFRLLPGNPMHDIIGIVCLIIYVMLPLALLVRWLYRVQSRPVKIVSPSDTKSPYSRWFTIGSATLHILLLIVLTKQVFFHEPKVIPDAARTATKLPGFTKRLTNHGVTQFDNASMLVYVKPIANFYVAEHSPLICWRGSGYTFSQVAMQTIQGTQVYTGILQKGTDRIYSAWWFDNGSHRTIEQTDWRWRMMQGEKSFCLVNVNVNNQHELVTAVQQMLTQRPVIN